MTWMAWYRGMGHAEYRITNTMAGYGADEDAADALLRGFLKKHPETGPVVSQNRAANTISVTFSLEAGGQEHALKLGQAVWVEGGAASGLEATRVVCAEIEPVEDQAATPVSASRHSRASRGHLTATAVMLHASPLKILRSMRGAIVDARIACPDVLHVEIKDSNGELWHLATQDAEWSPSDPAELAGRSVTDADIDAETGELRCKLSDGSLLDVKPADRETEDDPPNWELITPGGVVLEFGPGVSWQIGSADSRPSSRA